MASSHPQGTISQDQVEYDGGPWHTLDESRIAWISACEEELNQLVRHLANELDKVKLKTFLMANRGRRRTDSPVTTSGFPNTLMKFSC